MNWAEQLNNQLRSNFTRSAVWVFKLYAKSAEHLIDLDLELTTKYRIVQGAIAIPILLLPFVLLEIAMLEEIP